MASSDARAGRAGIIVALGDSLTSGHGIGTAHAFPAVLQARLQERGYEYLVVNAGVSGDTSSRAVQRLTAALNGDVRILIVALGVNDGLRGLPVEQLRANLTRIVEEARGRHISVVLCAMEAPPVYGWSYTAAFHRMYQELAAHFRLPLIPFVMQKVITNTAFVLPDRIHPNAAGARVIADEIWPYLEPLLRRVA